MTGPLIGRQQALDDLTAVMTAPPEGCRTVHVAGEPGIGKTILVEAAIADVGHTTIWCTADPMGQPNALDVLVRGLGAGAIDSTNERAAAAYAMSEVERLLDEGPTALVIDDVQWCDLATLRLLPRLVSAFHDRPLLLVTAGERPAGFEAWRLAAALSRHCPSTVMTVRPLTAAESREFVASVLGEKMSAAAGASCATAGGNPLLLRRMADAVASSGPDEEESGGRLPTTLPLGQIPHLAQITPECMRFLGFAAVLGRDFDTHQLGAVCGSSFPTVVTLVGEAVASGLLKETRKRLRFRHEVIRATLAAELPATIRSELHRSSARNLTDSGGDPARIADHLLSAALTAADHEWVRAVVDQCVIDAPDRVLRLWRHYLASAHFAGPLDPRRVDVQAQIALVQLSQGHVRDAEASARAVLECGGGDEAAMRACLSVALIWQGKYDEARGLAESAAVADELKPWDRADQVALAGAATLMSGDSKAAVQALDIADRAASATGSRIARVRVLVTSGHIAHCQGDLARARALLDNAVLLCVSDGSRAGLETFAHALLGLALTDDDDTERAQQVFHLGDDLGRARGSLVTSRCTQMCRAFADASLGQFDLAAAAIDQHLAATDEATMLWEPALLSRRAFAALQCEGPDAAEWWLRQLPDQDVLDQEGTVYGTAWRSRAAAAVRLARGDVDGALSILWCAWQDLQAAGVLIDTRLLATELVDASRRVQDVAKAWAVVEALEELADRNPGVRSLTTQALTVRGMVAGDCNLLMSATELAEGLAHRLVAARAAEEAALALIASGRPQSARKVSRDALDGYAGTGASFEAARARAALRRAGIRVREPARARPRAGWEALTPAEQVVARYVERGLSNSEIAAELVVSKRTVESHVSHVLAKLALRSRSDLILAAARHEMTTD